ncbi:hypothetical protein ACA910_022703 [Epithemia clementina (nom. ined.)]
MKFFSAVFLSTIMHHTHFAIADEGGGGIALMDIAYWENYGSHDHYYVRNSQLSEANSGRLSTTDIVNVQLHDPFVWTHEKSIPSPDFKYDDKPPCGLYDYKVDNTSKNDNATMVDPKLSSSASSSTLSYYRHALKTYYNSWIQYVGREEIHKFHIRAMKQTTHRDTKTVAISHTVPEDKDVPVKTIKKGVKARVLAGKAFGEGSSSSSYNDNHFVVDLEMDQNSWITVDIPEGADSAFLHAYNGEVHEINGHGHHYIEAGTIAVLDAAASPERRGIRLVTKEVRAYVLLFAGQTLAKQMQQQQSKSMGAEESWPLALGNQDASETSRLLNTPKSDRPIANTDGKDIMLNTDKGLIGEQEDMGEIALTCCPPPGGYGSDPLCGLGFQVKFGVPIEVKCFDDEVDLDGSHHLRGAGKGHIHAAA